MSALTKTFVVLLVVMSLLSAAGFIVFVNRVENFKTAQATSTAALTRSQTEVSSAKTQAAALQASLAASRQELDHAVAESGRITTEDAAKVAALNATIAQDASRATIDGVTRDNISAALAASEGQRKTQQDALASARSDLDKARVTVSENDIAISNLTNRVDVDERKVTDLSEQVAQGSSEKERLSGILKEHDITSDDKTEFARLSTPPINGVVRQTGPINGIPYATISVGSAESVQKGMVFNVVDRTRSKFLGLLTIDQVDLHEATGRLEGPAVPDIRVGVDVRTQL